MPRTTVKPSLRETVAQWPQAVPYHDRPDYFPALPCADCGCADIWHNHADDCAGYLRASELFAAEGRGFDSGFERGYNQAVRNTLQAVVASGLQAVVDAVYPMPNNRDIDRLLHIMQHMKQPELYSGAEPRFLCPPDCPISSKP